MRLPAVTFLGIILGTAFSCAAEMESRNPDFIAADVHDQIVDGRYRLAIETIKTALDRAKIKRQDPTALFVELAMVLTESGLLTDAEVALAKAEPRFDYPMITSRIRAALHLARGEYREAASAAEQAYRLSASSRSSKTRCAYAKAIQAEALLRLGDLPEAESVLNQALAAVSGKPNDDKFYGPRILYSACLIQGYLSTRPAAEANCHIGLSFAKSRLDHRDKPLGYLTLAEIRLRRGDLVGTREAASESLFLTTKLFGRNHQDAVRALEILALIDAKEGKMADAAVRANQAREAALHVFGEDSPRVQELNRSLAEIPIT